MEGRQRRETLAERPTLWISTASVRSATLTLGFTWRGMLFWDTSVWARDFICTNCHSTHGVRHIDHLVYLTGRAAMGHQPVGPRLQLHSNRPQLPQRATLTVGCADAGANWEHCHVQKIRSTEGGGWTIPNRTLT